VSVKEKLIAWSPGGMIMTEENQSTQRRTCLRFTLSTINPTWCGLGLNADLQSDGYATNRLSHGTAHSHAW